MSKKKNRKKHPSRDTRFARYAAHHWNQLEAAFALDGVRIDHYQHEKPAEIAQAILAKQLYEFAEHVCGNMRFTFARDIPDLPKQKR